MHWLFCEQILRDSFQYFGDVLRLHMDLIPTNANGHPQHSYHFYLFFQHIFYLDFFAADKEKFKVFKDIESIIKNNSYLDVFDVLEKCQKICENEDMKE